MKKVGWIQIHSREWINSLHVERVHVHSHHDVWRTTIYMTSGEKHDLYFGNNEIEARSEADKIMDELQRYIRSTFYLH